jgi:uncharacterized protein YnzC (UPF0291/DUF896 family)
MKTYTQFINELSEAKDKLTPHEVLTNIAKNRTRAQKDSLNFIKRQMKSKNPKGLDHMQMQGMKNLHDVGADITPDRIRSVARNAYAKYKSQNPNMEH